MNVEQELQRVLRTRDTPLQVADPVGAVRSGMRRRRRTQRVQVLAAGAGVAAIALSAAALVGNPWAATAPTPGATQPATQRPPSDLTAVPAGFTAQDLSFVTTQHGWALGTAPCGTASCTIELVTTDGGSTWSRRPAPTLPRTCTPDACVTRVRFADEKVGYAFGPSLYLTNDGGKTWSRQSTSPVYGLEIAAGTVSRVVSREDGCPGCTFVVQSSDVGSVVWSTRHSSDLLRADAAMVRYGSRLAVPLFANPAGGAGDAHASLLLSTDSGTTWTTREDPCGPTSSNAVDEVDARELSFGPEGLLVALCQPRTAQNAASAVRMSADSGRTFGPARSTPGIAVHVAAVSADRIVAEVWDGSTDALILSRDGGRIWTRVAEQPMPNGADSSHGFLAFSTRLTGTWVGSDESAVWRTTDGGATWTQHSFG
jgi:photosystem II stability/assembly factor-like uncharacterized protein